jgi:N-acetylmuramoyl-L-alanine amidase
VRPHPALALLLIAVAALPAAAVTVTAPQGASEVFSRADLIDLVALLRLTGAEVQFAPAAGSYSAVLGAHEVQFTPGGNLAVVDGRLTSLPGPVRLLEGHVVGSAATATSLLLPLGWTLRGGLGSPELTRVGGAQQLDVSAVRGAAETTVVVRGVKEKPQVASVPGTVTLQFATPVELAHPIAPVAELLGGELHDNVLTLRLAHGSEATGSYTLDDPPRFVLRVARSAPVTPLATARTGPLVVLDPGHGGEDDGAKGPGNELEKAIALAVARATAARLQADGIPVRLTRDADETVSLTDRTALANRLGATVFVSIHANASPAKGARGAETYYMSADASDAQAAQAAAQENAGAAQDAVQLILWDLAHVANLNNSARLARTLQDKLDALQGIRDRGIRQAPFVVLTGATMPAALVEVGFLSNPDEANRLLARDTQEAIAGALAEGIAEFIRTPTPVPSPTLPASP